MCDASLWKLISGFRPSPRNWQGSAEALPLRDGCADLVLMSMVYHHLTNPTSVASECHRVLRQGGYTCIRNGTRESDCPHRHFFPALHALIGSDLPSRRDIESEFTAAMTTKSTPAAPKCVHDVLGPFRVHGATTELTLAGGDRGFESASRRRVGLAPKPAFVGRESRVLGGWLGSALDRDAQGWSTSRR
jgi:SAM-dependent methyltransferase